MLPQQHILRPMPTRGAPERSTPPRRAHPDAFWLLALTAGVLWMYAPPGLITGEVLYGYDSFVLHVRRLEFAREHLFGPSPSLPGWYPREFLGTPFWSNLQNFPFIPTRLLLLLIDPWAAHGVGSILAAVLAAAFTFLFCRRLGIGALGAAVAGWTFACCGFFAARVMAGHLPLLEAYPALPLLLWLVERYAGSSGGVEPQSRQATKTATKEEEIAPRMDTNAHESEEGDASPSAASSSSFVSNRVHSWTDPSPAALRRDLLVLALATGCVMLAGHPQLPVYAVGSAFLYLLVRTWGRRALVGAAAMVSGVLCMSFVLYPMFLLVRRSTRVLPLAPAANDVYFPFSGLTTFVLPWHDARPKTDSYWDTVTYVGLLPLVAVIALALRWLLTGRRPARTWLFLAALATFALLLAFPRPWSAGGGFTILRSPARQLYLTVFGLSLAAGVAIDLLLRFRPARAWPRALLPAAAMALVALHVTDLRVFTRGGPFGTFIYTTAPPPDPGVPIGLAQAVGDGRVAMDAEEVDPANRRLDDAGVYDSVLLARPYRALMALSGRPPELNTQIVNGAFLSPRALAWAGVRMVVTERKNLPLPVVHRGEKLTVYSVPNPLPRAGFVPLENVRYADDEAVLSEFRAGLTPSPERMFLPPSAAANAAAPQSAPAPTTAPQATIAYRRPHPDTIEIDITAPTAGYVRILESFDPGWTATVNGQPAEILPADTFVSAVKVAPGTHQMRMTYHTPGFAAGLALSAVGAAVLAIVALAAPRFAFGVMPSTSS